VVFISPPWFFYESMIVAVRRHARPGGTIDPETFDLDLDAIAAALTPRTRAIIVNSPHNPTGKIYSHPRRWSAWRAILTEASERFGRRIYLLSDESYSRIVFDGRTFHEPDGLLPGLAPALHLREDAAHAGTAHRVHRAAARHDGARPSGTRSSPRN
jgi:aspartate aminotransferase